MKPRRQAGASEAKAKNRDQVLIRIFQKRFLAGLTEVPFSLNDIREALAQVSRENPDYSDANEYDIRYQYTSGRQPMPDEVERHGPWMIEGRGKGKYAFVKLASSPEVMLPSDLATIFIPDATPEIVAEYAGEDEQGILAKLHYNRLLDIFLQLTCYHLQNHWRTSIKGKGQIEVDDLYVALNTRGCQFVIPIEAKSHTDRLSKTQIAHMIAFAQERYAELIVRPVGVQELKDGSLVLVEFSPAVHPDQIEIVEMRRYKLVSMSEVPIGRQQGHALG